MRFALLFCWLSLCSASLNRLKYVFKGKNDLKDAILSEDRVTVLHILRWNSCGILLAQEHFLLKLLVTTEQRKLLHEAFEVFGENLDSCLIKSVQSALKHDDTETLDAILGIIKEHNNDQVTGPLFLKCAAARNYRCVSILVDWHVPLTHDTKNIFHFAAEMDDPILIKYAPMNEIFLDKADESGNYPMNYVHSRSMAEKLNERWQHETCKRPPTSWGCVHSMHYMTTIHRIPDYTLPFRASILAHQLQRSAESSPSPPFVLTVSRRTVFKDSYVAIQRAKSRWYRDNLKLEIVFDTEMGIDAGGPRLEWLSLMVDAMFKPKPDGRVEDFTAPLFAEVDNESGMYAPIMNYSTSVYEFAGSIIALAFREKITLKVNLIPSCVKFILNNVFHLNMDNFNQQHPTQYKSLQNLKNYSEEEIEGAELVFESNPKVKVTKSNLNKYIEDFAFFHTFSKYEPFLEALSRGFNKLNRVTKLHTIFNQQEMTDILRGGHQIDLESLKKHSIVTSQLQKINPEGAAESKKVFWEMMEMLSEVEKFEFFKFVTGRNSVPFEGITGLEKKLDIRLDYQIAGHIPTASTCFSKIYFAEDIKTPEEMKRRLLLSMENAVGFSLA